MRGKRGIRTLGTHYRYNTLAGCHNKPTLSPFLFFLGVISDSNRGYQYHKLTCLPLTLITPYSCPGKDRTSKLRIQSAVTLPICLRDIILSGKRDSNSHVAHVPNVVTYQLVHYPWSVFRGYFLTTSSARQHLGGKHFSRGEPIFHFLLDTCSLLTAVQSVTTREPNIVFIFCVW